MTQDTGVDCAHPAQPLRIFFPRVSETMDQDQEWFSFEHEGQRHRLRLHDYGAMFEIPGLYESLVYEALNCRSPQRVVGLLQEALAAVSIASHRLRVLDLGAGNGIVAEQLQRIGVRSIVGLDLLPEAAKAAKRDRPGAYEDYVVTDLTSTDSRAGQRLRDFEPNCLVTVAALGFGDVPPVAFANAFNLLPAGGWLAMCIKDRFLEDADDSGFGKLIRGMVAEGAIEVVRRQRYVHRFSVAGERLLYEALIARSRHPARLPA